GGDARIAFGCGRQRAGHLRRQLHLRPLRPQPIERHARRDTPRPGRERKLRLKTVVRAINAPEGLHREVFRGSSVTDHAQDPAVNRMLMLAEELLECVEIAIAEPLQHAAGHAAGAVGHPSSLSNQAYEGVGRKVTRWGSGVGGVSGVCSVCSPRTDPTLFRKKRGKGWGTEVIQHARNVRECPYKPIFHGLTLLTEM